MIKITAYTLILGILIGTAWSAEIKKTIIPAMPESYGYSLVLRDKSEFDGIDVAYGPDSGSAVNKLKLWEKYPINAITLTTAEARELKKFLNEVLK